MRHTMMSVRLWPVLLTPVLSGGCPSTAPPADPPTGGGTVSFRDQIRPIFDTHCAGCHSAGGLADQSGIALRLTAAVSYDLLVDRMSVQDASLTLVVPGNAAASFLFQKVNSDTPAVGSRMPLARAALADADVELIRLWIDEGALNN